MDSDPITWTGTPDDQRAEWRGMVAIVKRHAQNGALYCGVGTASDVASLFHSADCMLWPEYPVTAKWLCELVMRHEAAKAELEQAREVNHKLHRRCQQAEAASTCHYAKLFRESQAELERWKRRAELWKRAAKAQMDERRDALWQCCEAVMDKLGIVRKGQ